MKKYDENGKRNFRKIISASILALMTTCATVTAFTVVASNNVKGFQLNPNDDGMKPLPPVESSKLEMVDIVSIGHSGFVNPGDKVVLEAETNVTEESSVTFTWYKNGEVVGRDATYSFYPQADDNNQEIKLVAEKDGIKKETVFTIQVADPTSTELLGVSVKEIDHTGIYNPGDSIKLSAQTVPESLSDVTYAWSIDGKAIGSGTNSLTYPLKAEDNGKYIKVTVTQSSISKSVQFKLNVKQPNIVALSSVKAEFVNHTGAYKAGEKVELKATAMPNNVENVTYTWYKDSTQIGTGATCSFEASEADKGKTIKVVAKQDKITKEASLALDVVPKDTPTINSLNIWFVNNLEKYKPGDEIVVASSINPDNLSGVSYQWYKGDEPIGTNDKQLQFFSTADDDNKVIKLVATLPSGISKEASIILDLILPIPTPPPVTGDPNIIKPQDVVPEDQTKYDYTQNNSLFYKKDVPTKSKTINNGVYDDPTLFCNKYGKYGFKYPAWNYNYEVGNNKFLNVDGKQVNMRAELTNERTPSGKKYCDPVFVKEQIKNGTLKRHPAADVQYQQDVRAIPDRVDSTISVSTSSNGILPLGVWIPAGEPVEIQFDPITWQLMKETNYTGMKFIINDNFYDVQLDPDEGGISNRYPYILTEFAIDPSIYTENDATRSITVGSPFGGVLNLFINWPLKTPNPSPFFDSTHNVQFTVKNCFKTLLYVDGYTSEQDWNHQLEEVKQGKIAPNFSGGFTYGTINIPFTHINELGGWSVDKLKYPKENFRTINDFLFLSNYFNMRDLGGNFIRINFRVSEDIRHANEGGWGGHDSLEAMNGWVMPNIFGPTDTIKWWTFSDAWGFMHEINHNFQMDFSYFKWIPKMHPQTNQVNVFDNAFIGNDARWRSEHNPIGSVTSTDFSSRVGNEPMGHNRYNTEFGNLMTILVDPGLVDEYSMYKAIWSMVGPRAYAENGRHEISINNQWNNPEKNKQWTYMFEISHFSNFFGYNFWPALNKLQNRVWNRGAPLWDAGATGPQNRWPENYESANADEKKMIDDLAATLPEVDFVANLYACGVYKYDYKTGTWAYTEDAAPAFQIPANQDFVFDFGKNIMSWNEKFDWNNLEIGPSKLGARIEKDAKDPKKVIYHPAANTAGQVDEFDITITPTDFPGKTKNYIPNYKWKVKVRQEVNGMKFTTYEPFADQSLTNDELFAQFDTTPVRETWLYPITDQFYLRGDQKQGIRQQFKFVVTEPGEYDIRIAWHDAGRVMLDGKEIARGDTERAAETVYKEHLSPGQVLDFDVKAINSSKDGAIYMDIYKDGNPYNYEHNVMIPTLDKVGQESDMTQYVTNEKYTYKDRRVNYDDFENIDLFPALPMETNQFDKISFNDMTWKLDFWHDFWGELNFKNMCDFNKSVYISNPDNPYGPFAIPMIYTFNEPQTIGSILFANNAGNWLENTRLDDVSFEFTLNDGSKVNKDYVYGSQFNDKTSPYTVCTFYEPIQNVKSVRITLKADGPVDVNGIAFSNNVYGKLHKNVALNNTNITLTGKWKNVKNDDQVNLSCINNSFYTSTTQGDAIEFTIKNMEGFTIIGRNYKDDGQFDVYIDDVPVGTSYQGSKDYLGFNYDLFTHMQKYDHPIKVRIVHKDNKPIYINYLTLYGHSSDLAIKK